MRAVIQRVSDARVRVDGEIVGDIGVGVLILLGIRVGDTSAQVRWLADKVAPLRIFPDDEGKLNRSVIDIGGAVLVVSQFTLYADCRKGRRPSFIDAAAPTDAEPLYEAFVAVLRGHGLSVATGRFGADMKVELSNDGPVTLIIDTPE